MVEVSKNGWLFLKNDSNNINAVLKGERPLQNDDLVSISDMLKKRCLYYKENGIKIITAVIPDKNVACNKLRSEQYKISSNRPAIQIKKNLTDLPDWAWYYDFLTSEETDEALSKIYRKKDTHLTDKGWYEYFKKILDFSSISLIPIWDEEKKEGVGGDLGNKLDPPQHESVTKQIFKNCGEVILDEITESLNNGYHLQNKWIINENKSGTRLKALIFGTSTTYHGRNNLFSVFGKTYIKWSTKVNYSDIARIKPDIVICVVAERYISGGWRDENEQN
jgi:hypothetical protein